MDATALILIAVLVILISMCFFARKSVKYPLPGPTGRPLIGYIPFMTRKPYIKLMQLAKTYGPVYKLRMGSVDVVVLCDFKSIKTAFADEAYMGRPPDMPFEFSEETIRTGAILGLPWKEQRRFSLHMFRDLGFGKTRMEEHIKEEIHELLERMSESADKNRAVVMFSLLAPSMSNNIASLVFGNRLKYSDPKRQRLDSLLNEISRLAGNVFWQSFFPWARAISAYFRLGSKGKLIESLEELKVFCSKELEAHEKTLDEKNIRDFMDGYLLEIRKKSNEPDSTFKKGVLLDLSRAFFSAGSETVRVTVDWVMLLCASKPELQKKLHREIDEVLGTERFPSWQDRLNMPFTEAAICETMRWRSVVPLNIMRYTLKDAELNGYSIPKHSPVLAVLWAIDHDESLWGEDAHEYKPERFLTDNGQKVVKPEHFIPFSIGKRACPGKSLAEIEVFLYVVAILQKFEISLPPGQEADMEGELGISLSPKPQDLYIKRR